MEWYEEYEVTTYVGEVMGLAPGWVRKNFKLPHSNSTKEFDIFYEHDSVDEFLAGTLETALNALNNKEGK